MGAVDIFRTRFEAKYTADPDSGCWLWTAALNASGYGRFKGPERLVQAHRFSYEMHVGPIPLGLVLDHLCRVRNCVNPSHLEPVTHRENLLRGIGPTATRAAQTHCVHGHKFTEANTYHPPKKPTTRDCRICRAAANERSDARRRGKAA